MDQCIQLFQQINFVIKNSLDAGIQDKSTSISIVVKFTKIAKVDLWLESMKVTNINKHEIVDTRA